MVLEYLTSDPVIRFEFLVVNFMIHSVIVVLIRCGSLVYSKRTKLFFLVIIRSKAWVLNLLLFCLGVIRVPIFYYVFNIIELRGKTKSIKNSKSIKLSCQKKAGCKIKLPFMFSDTNFPRLDCFELSSATFIFILVKIVVGLSGGGETLF